LGDELDGEDIFPRDGVGRRSFEDVDVLAALEKVPPRRGSRRITTAAAREGI